MRHINFRDWNPESKEMRYFNLDHYDREEHGAWGDVMQFTGLLDNNLKDIYEGDIIHSEIGDTYEVKFNAPCFFFIENGTEFIFQQYAMNVHGMEIVGNIYENPELLNNQ